ncbi:MAG: flagellar biosynthesis regulator FlaF [Rhodospirillaceae bacterium]
MTSSNRPNAYSNVPTASAEPRQVEGWALTETALRMQAAQQEPLDETALLHAARLNWRLWTIFQASLLEPNCPLVPELRNGILSLSNFVDKHTAAFLADPRAEKLDVLIKINHELAGGLMSPLPNDAASSETATPVSQN